MKKPIRVLYLIGTGGFGGIERHVQCLLASIDRTQIDPHLCVVRKPGAISDAIKSTGVPVYEMGATSGHDLIIVKLFTRLLKRVKPDIVHAHEMPLYVVVALFFFPRTKVILSLHCRGVEKSVRHSFADRVLRLVSKRIDYFLPVSAATWGRKADFSKYSVFYNPMDMRHVPEKKTLSFQQVMVGSCEPDADVNQEAEGAHFFGMVGRMVEQKDWWSFLKCSAEVLERDPKAYAIAIGDGPQREELKSFWAKCCKNSVSKMERLYWMGFRDDAKRLIGGLDVFLLTSHHEELPTTLLEAYVMRTMVVGYIPVGGVQEILDLAGGKRIGTFLVERDHMKLADAVMEAFGSDALRRECTRNAYELLHQHFNSENNCRGQLMDIYRKVLDA